MKRKRTNKSVVPMGRIWWSNLKRHPLHRVLGQVLRHLRDKRCWSLADLACASGLAKSYLCGLESGEHSPSLEVMLRLEAVFALVGGGLQRLTLCWSRRGRASAAD